MYRKNTVNIGFGTTCNFRYPLGFLECTLLGWGGESLYCSSVWSSPWAVGDKLQEECVGSLLDLQGVVRVAGFEPLYPHLAIGGFEYSASVSPIEKIIFYHRIIFLQGCCKDQITKWKVLMECLAHNRCLIYIGY